MSEARGWRCPTGAGSGLERTAPEVGGGVLSSDGVCADAVPARDARVASATPPRQHDFKTPDKTCSPF
jgi:hypothetical protein